MAHRTNRFADNCARCRTPVAENQGTLQGPPWRTICQSCLPFPAAAIASPRIELRLVGTVAHVILRGRLNGAFQAYRAACEGICESKKLGEGWETSCKVDHVPELITRLAAIDGIKVEVEPALTATLQARASQQVADIVGANDRIAAIESTLAARGQALFGYQKTGIPWLAARTCGLLADDMGLGKTLQALLAAPAGAPILVIAPAVAKGVWKREVAKWRPDLTPVVCKGKSGRNAFRWPTAGEIVIVNYDILPGTIVDKDAYVATLPAELVTSCPEGIVVIADEAHAVKSNKAQRSKKFRTLAELARSRKGRTWLLTATPILNRPPELWALLQAGGLTEAFGSWAGFCRAFNGYKARYGFEWGTPTAKAGELLKNVQLRRLKRDVLKDLPAKRYQQVSVNGLDRATIQACDGALAALDAVGIDLDDAHALVSETATSGAAFEQLSKARHALAVAKVEHVLALAAEYEEAEEPVVVFSAHRAPIEALGQREGWATITGSVSPEERTRIENAFQAGELKGVACTIQAGGVAITLTHASHAIFVDRLFTPSLNVQAEDRIHRIGQSRGVLIIDLIAEHALDERLYEILTAKSRLIAASVDEARRQADDADEYDLQAALGAALGSLAAQSDDEAGLDEAAYQAALSALNAELAQRDLDRKRQGRESRWDKIVNERAQKRGVTVTSPEDHVRRAAANDRERWAAAGLITLAALDPDHAGELNDVGFNKADGWLGHQLAGRVASGLTELEWALAVTICKKYHRQIGACPKV